MKNYIKYAVLTAIFGPCAHAADLMPCANTVTANMISEIQHTIANRALGGGTQVNISIKPIRMAHKSPDRYGEMLYYGEFGDDTGILPMLGHAGGDEEYTPVRLGVDFSHSNDEVKFDNLTDVKSKTNIARISVAPKIEFVDLEIFAGYAGHDSHNADLDIDGDGAFFGVAARANFDGLYTGIVMNGGVMANTATSFGGARDFENVWLAATVGAEYNIDLYPNISLIPGGTLRYMWIRSQDYTAPNGDSVDITNVGGFSLSPSVRVDFALQDNWHLGARAAYVMNFMDGGEISVDHVKWPDLDTRNYVEYDIDFGYRTDRLDLSINLGRHDIGRTGWHGGFRISYMF